jgi:NAD(P)-dependent dehydrogenase (short-subunit alcohol dehydrogenase family)
MYNYTAANMPDVAALVPPRREFLRQFCLLAGSAATVSRVHAQSNASGAATPVSCSDIQTPMKDVRNKVAFITGGDSGIGLGIARAFASAGMKVCITYRSTKHLAEAKAALGESIDRIHTIYVDVADRAGMFAAAKETIEKFGRVHVLVNNAGVDIGGVPLANTTFDDWDWVLGVNVSGVFNGIRAFLPHIRAHNEGGHVVSTSSIQGLFARNGGGLYSTTRFAVVGMMEALRWELANTNIGVSVFCPGFVSSNLYDSRRNRPKTLPDAGKEEPSHLPDNSAAKKEKIQEILKKDPGAALSMDPLEAGERVLRGIRNNDLYILSHPEFEQGIRDRNEALLASIPIEDGQTAKARVAGEDLADILRNPIYYKERDRKLCERARLRR